MKSLLNTSYYFESLFKNKEHGQQEQGSIENPRCFFDIAVDHTQQRIVIELFANKLPKTCANFMSLIQGDQVDALGRKMHFKDSVLYEMIPGWVVAGGDFVNNNGTGGECIFGNKEFEDENFAISHDRPGLISMLGHGPNTNSSLWFINLQPAEWLTGYYVAFGQVLFGLETLQQLAEKYGTKSGIPKDTVRIIDCGDI